MTKYEVVSIMVMWMLIHENDFSTARIDSALDVCGEIYDSAQTKFPGL